MSAPAPPGYHDEPAVERALEQAAAHAGERAWLRTIGHSVDGRPLRALTLVGEGRTPAAEDDRPHVVVIGTIHGNEVIASEVALRLLPHLSQHRADLLAEADVTVVPVVNPDGRERTLASLRGRPFAGTPRRNARGVDLNRNWPVAAGATPHWLPWAGTRRPWLPWYFGPEPCSEPETQALLQLFEERPPAVLLNLHSVGEIVTYPWSSFGFPSEHRAALEAMAAAFNAARPASRPFRSKQSNAWYPIVGSSNDFVHDRYDTLPVTVELSVLRGGVDGDRRRLLRWFWWSNPADPDSYAAGVLEPCAAAMAAGVAGRVRR